MRSHARVWFLAWLRGVLLVHAATRRRASALRGSKTSLRRTAKVNTCARERRRNGANGKQSRRRRLHAGRGAPQRRNRLPTSRSKPRSRSRTVPEGVGTGAIVTHIRTDVAPESRRDSEAPGSARSKTATNSNRLAGTRLLRSAHVQGRQRIGVNQAVDAGRRGQAAPEGGDLPRKETTPPPAKKAWPRTSALRSRSPNCQRYRSAPGGIAYKSRKTSKRPTSHTLIEGNVEWGAEAAGTGKADYHDYFEINVSPDLP